MTVSEQATFESQTSAFRADISHQAAGVAQQSEQSESENNPAHSKADVTSNTEAESADADEQADVRRGIDGMLSSRWNSLCLRATSGKQGGHDFKDRVAW